MGHPTTGRSRRLSDRALRVLLRIGDLQRSHQVRVVPVVDVIDPASPAQWDSIHILARRLLLDTADAQSVRLTRAGWAAYRHHR